MSKQQQPCVITCQLCGKTVTVNMHLQRMKYCRKCDKKLNEVGLKVQEEIDQQKAKARAKATKKAPAKPKKFKCPECEVIFPCPSCQDTSTVKKSGKATSKKGGTTNVQK